MQTKNVFIKMSICRLDSELLINRGEEVVRLLVNL